MLVLIRITPAWRVHTNLYKFGYNISSDISYTKYSSDLNLGQGLCIFTSFHFPDSRLYLLNSFDFYFDLFWMVWLKTSNKNLRIRDIRWLRNLRAVCWCRDEALKVRKLPLRLSAGVVCRPPPIFKRNLGRRKKLAEKVGRRKIYSPVPPPSKNNWWHGGLNVSKTLQVQLTTSLQRIPLLIC